jgi:cytochrome c peroxidase
MNLAWHHTFMWDGAINHLDMQSLFPITQSNEMNESIENVIRKLEKHKFYPRMYATAYSEKGITGEKTLKAISAFMLTLVSANSRYDSVMRKQSNFTEQEWNGYYLFKKNCNSCHQEPLFTNFEFENNGLPVDPTLNDYGRMNISHNPIDSLKFKVPTLRNIEFTYPYMHDGRFKKLQDVLHHYTSGIRPEGTVSKKLENPIVLSSNEKVDLLSFLLCLTDKEFLFHKNHSYPRHIFNPEYK